MTREISFRGKRAVVTGGATGLGAAVAGLVAAQGGEVIILDVNEAAGHETASRIGGHFRRCNVADPKDWADSVADIAYRLGPVHYAHLNAGIMSQRLGESLDQARIEALSPERYRAVIATNIDGVFFGLKTLLPHMIAEGGHCITVTSSAAGLIPISFDPVYALTKHALVGLVRSLALAYAAAPVRINALCPGGIDTQLVPSELAGNRAAMMTPEEMGAEVTSLLLTGASGEIRLKLSRDMPARAVAPPDITLGGG